MSMTQRSFRVFSEDPLHNLHSINLLYDGEQMPRSVLTPRSQEEAAKVRSVDPGDFFGQRLPRDQENECLSLIEDQFSDWLKTYHVIGPRALIESLQSFPSPNPVERIFKAFYPGDDDAFDSKLIRFQPDVTLSDIKDFASRLCVAGLMVFEPLRMLGRGASGRFSSEGLAWSSGSVFVQLYKPGQAGQCPDKRFEEVYRELSDDGFQPVLKKGGRRILTSYLAGFVHYGHGVLERGEEYSRVSDHQLRVVPFRGFTGGRDIGDAGLEAMRCESILGGRGLNTSQILASCRAVHFDI